MNWRTVIRQLESVVIAHGDFTSAGNVSCQENSVVAELCAYECGSSSQKQLVIANEHSAAGFVDKNQLIGSLLP